MGFSSINYEFKFYTDRTKRIYTQTRGQKTFEFESTRTSVAFKIDQNYIKEMHLSTFAVLFNGNYFIKLEVDFTHHFLCVLSFASISYIH